MHIKSIEVRNLLSFGPEKQEMLNFEQMNLFIGVNGSGKSNALRLIGDISYEYKQQPLVTNIDMVNEGTAHRALLFSNHIRSEFISNRLLGKSNSSGTGDLRIEYSASKRIPRGGSFETIADWPHSLEFKSGALCEGALTEFSNPLRIKKISSDWDDIKFTNTLNTNGDHFQDNAIVIFALRYIFQRSYVVGNGGYFYEMHTKFDSGGKTSNGGVGGFDKSLWTDGVLRVAKIIQQLRLGSVALIEEPELCLEPRAVRRFVDFLSWFGTADKDIDNASEFVKSVHKAWGNYVEDIQSSRNDDVKMPSRRKIQYFITSHSPILLSRFLELGKTASIYEFSIDWMANGVGKDRNGKDSNQSSLWSKVRKINSNPHMTLEALGASSADILQCNGIIWVEGPSDVIYIRGWLRMYARKIGGKQFVQGKHFQFQMYGGALLDSLYLQEQEGDPDVERRKLVDMFSFSRNAFVVMDSDAVKSDDGLIKDRSNYSAAKKYIKNQIEKLNIQGYKLGLWFAENDTKLRTIEEYLDEDSKNIARSGSKRVAAEKRVASWSGRHIDDFPEILPEIKMLYEKILSWQSIE